MTFTPDNLWRNSISIVLTTLQRHFFTVQSWFNGPNTAILLVYSMEKVGSTLYIKILIHDDFRYRLALLLKDEPKRTLGRVASNHQRRPTCAINHFTHNSRKEKASHDVPTNHPPSFKRSSFSCPPQRRRYWSSAAAVLQWRPPWTLSKYSSCPASKISSKR